MSEMASQITGVSIVCSTVFSGADQRKHQSSASLAFVWGIHRWPVNATHKGRVRRKMFPFDDVIMSDGLRLMGEPLLSSGDTLDHPSTAGSFYRAPWWTMHLCQRRGLPTWYKWGLKSGPKTQHFISFCFSVVQGTRSRLYFRQFSLTAQFPIQGIVCLAEIGVLVEREPKFFSYHPALTVGWLVSYLQGRGFCMCTPLFIWGPPIGAYCTLTCPGNDQLLCGGNFTSYVYFLPGRVNSRYVAIITFSSKALTTDIA